MLRASFHFETFFGITFCFCFVVLQNNNLCLFTIFRATALGGAIALGRTAGISTTFAAEDMNITLGMWLYGCTGIVAFMASLLLPVDTTGRAMTDETIINPIIYRPLPRQDIDYEVAMDQNGRLRSVNVNDLQLSEGDAKSDDEHL